MSLCKLLRGKSLLCLAGMAGLAAAAFFSLSTANEISLRGDVISLSGSGAWSTLSNYPQNDLQNSGYSPGGIVLELCKPSVCALEQPAFGKASVDQEANGIAFFDTVDESAFVSVTSNLAGAVLSDKSSKQAEAAASAGHPVFIFIASAGNDIVNPANNGNASDPNPYYQSQMSVGSLSARQLDLLSQSYFN